MKTFQELGTEIGELVEQKAAAYGESFAKSGDHLRMLFPDGLKPEQYDDALLLVRIFDKQMRIATDRDALGESPYADIAGYGILGSHMHQQRKASEPWPGTASADAAKLSSEDRRGSATTPSASATTMPSTAEKSVREPLPQPDGCCEPLTSAPAKTATEAASPSEEDRAQVFARVAQHLLELMRQCNHMQLCARCGHVYDGGSLCTSAWGEKFVLCKVCRPIHAFRLPEYETVLALPEDLR